MKLDLAFVKTVSFSYCQDLNLKTCPEQIDVYLMFTHKFLIISYNFWILHRLTCQNSNSKSPKLRSTSWTTASTLLELTELWVGPCPKSSSARTDSTDETVSKTMPRDKSKDLLKI